MKKLLLLVIVTALVFGCAAANADIDLKLSSKNLSALYDLYLQCDAQQQVLGLQDRNAYKTVTNYDSLERNPDRHKGEKNWTEYSFHFASYEDDRKIQMCSAQTGRLHGNQAVIPVSLSPSYRIGDTMEIKIGDNIYRIKVAGYNEDNIFCSPMNMGTYLIYISEKMYNDMEFENKTKAFP